MEKFGRTPWDIPAGAVPAYVDKLAQQKKERSALRSVRKRKQFQKALDHFIKTGKIVLQ